MTEPRQLLERFGRAARLRVRGRRALAGAGIAVALVSGLALVPPILAIAGWPVPWWWGPTTLGMLAGLALVIGAVVAAMAPVQASRVTIEADRRLGLEGALVTACQAVHSSDPISRLLVERTAATLAKASVRQAVPVRLPVAMLLVPALATVAFAISTRMPATSSTRAAAPQPEQAVTELSSELQHAVSQILMIEELPDHALGSARRVLELDDGLRRESLTEAQVREAVVELAESLKAQALRRSNDSSAILTDADGAQRALLEAGDILAAVAGTAGTDAVAVGGPERSPANEGTESTGSATAGAVSTAGDGAGLGRAALEPTPGAEGRSEVLSRAVWSLPASTRARHASRGGLEQDGDGAPGSASTPERSGARLSRRETHLTPVERSQVEAYFDSLERARDRERQRKPRGRQSRNEQETPS